MNTTHDDKPTTWRDLANQLTPTQIGYLDLLERQGPAGGSPVAYRQWLIGEALDYAAANKRAAELTARTPLPAGATTDGTWSDLRDVEGDCVRSLEWSRHDAAGIGVAVDGWQHLDGRVESHVSLYDAEKELTAESARQLAAALLEAADELERLQ